jgi:hypothetical protein
LDDERMLNLVTEKSMAQVEQLDGQGGLPVSEDEPGMAQACSGGLLAMFKKGWDDVLQESGNVEGYPVKTVMSPEMGGELNLIFFVRKSEFEGTIEHHALISLE